MNKIQRCLWASSLTILTLSFTFKPVCVYAASPGTVNNFDELIDYLFDPNTDAIQNDLYNSVKGLEIFSLPMAMYMYSVGNSNSGYVNLSDVNTISGSIYIDNKFYPCVLYLGDFSIDGGQNALIYTCPLFSYYLYNSNSSARCTVLCTPPTSLVGAPYFKWEISGIAGANLIVDCTDKSYGRDTTFNSVLNGRLTSSKLNHSTGFMPLSFFARSTNDVSVCLGLATSIDFPNVSFSPASLTEDWVNSVYPALKEKYPDVDDYLPIVNNAPLPEYENWVYPPDLPIPEIPTIELPTNDIPASAMQGVSFWFSNFTTFVDKLNVGWIIVLLIAIAFLFHVIFKF